MNMKQKSYSAFVKNPQVSSQSMLKVLQQPSTNVLIYSWIFTARVRTTREGTVFTGVCLFTYGGGVPTALSMDALSKSNGIQYQTLCKSNISQNSIDYIRRRSQEKSSLVGWPAER